MKKFFACIAVIALLAVPFAFSASAANGVDVVDTFESYFNKKDFIGSIHKGEGALKGGISTDTQASAPNRGDGKAAGNYRSMKAKFDFTEHKWGSVRNMTEDNYPLIEPLNANKDVFFTFYAKAEKAMVLRAEVDIKDCPFYKDVNLTTEWKKYTLSLRELEPELNDKYGKKTKIYERNAQKAWGSGAEEAFLVGFKFQVLKDSNKSLTKGTFWLDTFAFEGPTIKERTNNQNPSTPNIPGYDNGYDKPGSVPKDFVAPKPTTTTKPTNPPTKPQPNSSTPGSQVGKPNSSTPGSQVGKPNSSTPGSQVGKPNSSTPSGSSTVTDPSESSSAPVADPGTVTDPSSETPSAPNLGEGDEPNTAPESSQVGGKETGSVPTWVFIAIAGVVVLAGGGAAAYYLVVKKGASSGKTGNK